MKWADMHNEPGEGKSLYRLVNRETGEELDRKFLDDDLATKTNARADYMIPRFPLRWAPVEEVDDEG